MVLNFVARTVTQSEANEGQNNPGKHLEEASLEIQEGLSKGKIFQKRLTARTGSSSKDTSLRASKDKDQEQERKEIGQRFHLPTQGMVKRGIRAGQDKFGCIIMNSLLKELHIYFDILIASILFMRQVICVTIAQVMSAYFFCRVPDSIIL